MNNKSGMGSHQSTKMKNGEWLTPPELVEKLGDFDLDVCAPVVRPWDTAKKHFTIEDDGLIQEWYGRVFCNPPYGNESGLWLERMADHGRGIALIFARTETKMFFEYVWGRASGLLFIEGRLHFHYVDGSRASANAGAPSVLVAYGAEEADFLSKCSVKGKFISLI